MSSTATCSGCFRPTEQSPLCNHCATSNPPDDALPIGMSLRNGSFVLGKVLGRGGFGITYLAWDVNSCHSVAIKEYFPMDFARRSKNGTSIQSAIKATVPFDAARNKFVEEATKLRELGLPGGGRHENIVEVFDCFAENGTDYIVMEYLGDRDFEKYLNEQSLSRINFEQAFRILGSIMDGLAFLHQLDPPLLHLDIAADNICITEDGRVKLIDFGSARFSLKETEPTRSKSIIIKPGYSPKELYLYETQDTSVATDIYALGATFYRALKGDIPTPAPDRVSSLVDYQKDSVKPLSSDGVSVPDYVELAILKALAIKSSERFSSVSEFQDALEGKPDEGKQDEKSVIPRAPSVPSPGIAAEFKSSLPKAISKNKPLGFWRGSLLTLICFAAVICFWNAVSLIVQNDWTGFSLLCVLGVIFLFWCRWLVRQRPTL